MEIILQYPLSIFHGGYSEKSAISVSLLGPWELEECDRIAKNLVQYGEQHSRVIVGKPPDRLDMYGNYCQCNGQEINTPRKGCLCDVIISLDAFLHWFDDSGKLCA